MRRISMQPRSGWRERVTAQGLDFHTIAGATYWDESAAYVFTPDEAERIAEASDELHRCCLAAVERIVRTRRFAEFAIPEAWWPALERSWETERDAHLYGRFDLSLDGAGTPRLLEYNADTPTALLEAAVIQWFWLEDQRRNAALANDADQFNALHERLLERFARFGAGPWWFAAQLASREDAGTVGYLAEVAAAANAAAGNDARSEVLDLAAIGWNGRCFTDLREQRITRLFKLHPWEWLISEPFAAHLDRGGMQLVEPLWKLLLSTKAILPLLWEFFPDHPNLLRAERAPWGDTFVRKPLLSREGANVDLVRAGTALASSGGRYGGEGFIYQELCPLPEFAGRHAVIGSWVVGDAACGIGIREDDGPVTCDGSRFVPHVLLAG